jgi:hypothetical protein
MKKLMLALAILAAHLAPASANAQTVSVDTGITRLRYVTILVKDYDEALAWYTQIWCDQSAIKHAVHRSIHLPDVGIATGGTDRAAARGQTESCARSK